MWHKLEDAIIKSNRSLILCQLYFKDYAHTLYRTVFAFKLSPLFFSIIQKCVVFLLYEMYYSIVLINFWSLEIAAPFLYWKRNLKTTNSVQHVYLLLVLSPFLEPLKHYFQAKKKQRINKKHNTRHVGWHSKLEWRRYNTTTTRPYEMTRYTQRVNWTLGCTELSQTEPN